MFHDASDCAFLRRLEDDFPAVRAECARIPRDSYLPWPLREAYTGGWFVFPLYSADPDWKLAEACLRNAALAPRTVALVRSIPGALLAGFSLLTDGTHVYPHRDEVVRSTLRCHLGLEVKGPAGLRMGTVVRHHSEGRCLGFDSEEPHESFNLSGTDRIVLLVDVDWTAVPSSLADEARAPAGSRRVAPGS